MKVSFDARLFEKELMKALTWLVPMEKEALKEWCFAEYGHMYGALIKRCFIRVQAA